MQCPPRLAKVMEPFSLAVVPEHWSPKWGLLVRCPQSKDLQCRDPQSVVPRTGIPNHHMHIIQGWVIDKNQYLTGVLGTTANENGSITLANLGGHCIKRIWLIWEDIASKGFG